MASKTLKKPAAPTNRTSSATPRETTAIAASASADNKKTKVTIWPEWNDADVNAEKWEAGHKVKEDKKGKSPTVQSTNYFDDPDGKLEMPVSLRVDHMKRPTDFIIDKIPVVIDQDEMMNDFDLITPNKHLHESELIRYIISQITALWDLHTVKDPPPQVEPLVPGEDPHHTWKPWEHIYALCKVTKGPHIPLYNHHGKYVVRLFWMGCWRKIYVDDAMPYDDMGRLLLPATTLNHELWPMLLTKALIKVASLDYAGGSSSCEFGDFSVIHCLTGWLPEAIPIQHVYVNEIWEMLKKSLPEWSLPEVRLKKVSSKLITDADKFKDTSPGEPGKEDPARLDGPGKDKPEKTDKPPDKAAKEKGKDDKKEGKKEGKEDKKDKKDKDKDKDKNKDKVVVEEYILPEKPEIVIFATYCSTPKYPVKVSVLGEMADASERLRQNGLSHMYPHPIWITQTRSCPLEPPPPPEVIPAWKLIRPRKKKEPPSDEPKAQPETPKPIQCIELKSPFVNYKVSPVPIPTDTHYPKSSLERGGAKSRPSTANVGAIEETDENSVEVPPVNSELEVEKVEKVERVFISQEEAGGDSHPVDRSSASRPTSGKNVLVKRSKSVQGAPQVNRKVSHVGPPPPPLDVPKTPAKAKGTSHIEGLLPKAEDKVKGEKSHPVINLLVGDMVVETDTSPGHSAGEEVLEPSRPEQNSKPKKLWMDFDVFCKCFRNIYIYHKSYTYPYNQKFADLKNVLPTAGITAPAKPDKKLATSNTGTPVTDDKAPNYLFVDHLNPIEIVISFSALSRWIDAGTVPIEVDKKSHTNLKKDPKEQEKELTMLTNSSTGEGSVIREASFPAPVTPGTLVAEPYSWKSLVTGQPVLRLRTTGIRAAVLNLPAGRHVLRFMAAAPLAYTIHMCSTVPFIFGDEETVMAQLTNESCRFRDNALTVITSLGKCIQTFHLGGSAFQQAWLDLLISHCPCLADKSMSKRRHFQIFADALYSMLRKALKDITPDLAFSWRALMFDNTTVNILGIPPGSRPETRDVKSVEEKSPTSTSAAGVGRGSAKRGKKQTPVEGEVDKVSDGLVNREPTPEEMVAAVRMQAAWRRYWVRKIVVSRRTGTDDNVKVHENLLKSWSILEAQAEENGLYLFREMFRKDPDLMTKYPFYKDEWNKISYADYRGTYPDQGPQNWFIVFRDVFFVKEEMLAVPKLYVPINTCMLRVINNDTWEEIPCVFQRVAPYVYKRNKHGYTFVAEARTTDFPLASGYWRMRLIGSLSPLPSPKGNELNSNFYCNEIKDYYIPNNKNVIFRYSVKVLEDHLVSLQMNTSRPSVYIKLSILDNEEELLSVTGKGHVVIPAFIFQRTSVPAAEEDLKDIKRSSSRMSNKGAGRGKSKRLESGKSPERVTSAKSNKSGDVDLLSDTSAEERLHRYIIQAVVLSDSWPLSEASWQFVQVLKELEKNELKVTFKERAPSPPKAEKAAAPTAARGGKTKGSKPERVVKSDKDSKGSRPPSQQFDPTKPHWILRIISDEADSKDIELQKDTERADEIRALKKAWEDAEPGRAAKAMQSRLKYLSERLVKVLPSEGEGVGQQGETELVMATEEATTMIVSPEMEVAPPPLTPTSLMDADGEGNLTLEPPAPPAPKEIIKPLDLTPFIRKTLSEPRFLDDAELEERFLQQQAEIARYKSFREDMERWREQERLQRNQTKIKQLEQCQILQATLDSARDAINIPREAFRQRFLALEKKRQDELAAMETALKVETEAKVPERRKSSQKERSPSAKKKK